MKKFRYMDPEMIMTIVISLIILAVGVYAFFVTIDNLPTPAAGADYTEASNITNRSRYPLVSQLSNTSTTGNSVYNVVGIVLVIGAIMTIVGLVYSYVRPGY